jgi:hypothetical protein
MNIDESHAGVIDLKDVESEHDLNSTIYTQCDSVILISMPIGQRVNQFT